MITEIPTYIDQDDYVVRADLDGVEYEIRLQWSERGGYWLMDLTDVQSGEPVVLGRPCLVGNLLTLGYGRPAGQLTVIGDRDPQRRDWGTRCKLIYIDEDSVAETIA